MLHARRCWRRARRCGTSSPVVLGRRTDHRKERSEHSTSTQTTAAFTYFSTFELDQVLNSMITISGVRAEKATVKTNRSMMPRVPSEFHVPTSPVLNHPSSVKIEGSEFKSGRL